MKGGKGKETLHCYLRVSTLTQQEDGTSLQVQKELGIQKAKELGMKYQIWNEGAASSNYEDLHNRPVMTELLMEIDKGNIRNLFAYNIERLSRNDQTYFMIKYSIQKNEVILFTNHGKYNPNNPTDKLLMAILSAVAEYDNFIRTERSRLGKLNKVRDGGWQGGPTPYGFSLKNGRLAVSKDESKVVKKIFQNYSNGKSIADIKSMLDVEGVTARRGKLFTTGSLNKLLQNTHHLGYYKFTDKKSGTTIDCVCPKIVDETVWNNVKARREKILARKSQNNRTKKFYLLRNLMFCNHCGSKMSGRIHEIRNQRIYYCPNKERSWVKAKPTANQKYKRGKVGNHGCDMTKSLNIPITDEFVWSNVERVVLESSLLKEGFKKEVLTDKFSSDEKDAETLKKMKSKSTKLGRELQQIQSSIADVETYNMLKKYDSKVYEKIKANLDAELVAKKDEIEQNRIRINEIGNNQRWLDWIGKYGEKVQDISSYSDEDKASYLHGIIDRITVSLDKKTQDHILEIVFNLPIVGDSISFIDNKNKKKGYIINEGQKSSKGVILSSLTETKSKMNRKLGRQKQNAEKKKRETTYHLTKNERHCRIVLS